MGCHDDRTPFCMVLDGGVALDRRRLVYDSGLVGAEPVALVVSGWTLVGAGLLTAILALAESRLVRDVVFGRQTSSSDIREREAAPAVTSLQPR
jgi:hypothetical protein